MRKRITLKAEAPSWLVLGAITACVIALVWTGWSVATGHEGSTGPDKKVYPGMYDLRAEAAKAIAARKQQPLKGDGVSERE